MAPAMNSKGQVTIPKWVHDRLDLRPGDLVEFERHANGRIVMKKSTREGKTKFAPLRGHAGPGVTTDELMAMTRGD